MGQTPRVRDVRMRGLCSLRKLGDPRGQAGGFARLAHLLQGLMSCEFARCTQAFGATRRGVLQQFQQALQAIAGQGCAVAQGNAAAQGGVRPSLGLVVTLWPVRQRWASGVAMGQTPDGIAQRGWPQV